MDGLESKVAENTEAIRGLREDVHELRDDHKDDHHRLRTLEAAVKKLVDASNDARRSEQNSMRRVEIRIQWLTASVALATVVVSILLAVIHH